MDGCYLNCGEVGNWCECDDYVDLRQDIDIGGEG